MRRIKTMLCLLAVALFSGCSAVINDFILSRPDVSKITGKIVATDGSTLAFSYDKDVIVFTNLFTTKYT
jgi:hypothetical protein